MAAVSISPLPYSLSSMSNRRAPLASNPNAANSPYRAVSKQKRSYATVQREDAYGQPPPTKKQMLESQSSLRTPPRHYSTQSLAEGRVFTKTSNASQQTAFERKLVAIRDRPAQQLVVKAERKSEENLESIRQWQRHHRKIFPTFVFYFESIPEDARVKYTKQVNALGAREEKFFSNAVTHVVTTRAIPPERVTSPTEAVVQSSTTNESNSQNSHPQTINPSLLDRSSESTQLQSESFGTRGKFTFDAQVGRKVASHGQDAEARRQHARNADVLCRARELGMKIWALEKLQRMMTTMFDTDTGYQAVHGHNTRSHSVQGATAIPRTTTELSQLLRNERINGPSDRDLTVSTKEITVFKGPFIYIHDIDEKQKPIMVREYAKVANKEEGDWPQFRSVPNGKCPFVEEVDCGRREVDREKELVRRQQEKEQTTAPRTRAATAAVEASRMQPPKAATSKRALVEMGGGSNRNITVTTNEADPFTSSKAVSHRTDRVSSRGNQNAFVSRAGVGRLFGGEPVASGLQASNITSAIRSQMISSTAAQPGAKAGTSKEVHGLQRKILEKNSGGPGSYGLTSSHRMTDLNTAIREDTGGRPSRRKQELELIAEDTNQPEQEENPTKVDAVHKAKAIQQQKAKRRDAKPGYCENCQDKFDDFDEHILSRKHRKFADKQDNWKELDALLRKLVRPPREVEYDAY